MNRRKPTDRQMWTALLSLLLLLKSKFVHPLLHSPHLSKLSDSLIEPLLLHLFLNCLFSLHFFCCCCSGTFLWRSCCFFLFFSPIICPLRRFINSLIFDFRILSAFSDELARTLWHKPLMNTLPTVFRRWDLLLPLRWRMGSGNPQMRGQSLPCLRPS